MLLLTRMRSESVVMDVPPSDKHQRIVVTVMDIQGDRNRLGFEAPREVAINRKEIADRIEREKAAASRQ